MSDRRKALKLLGASAAGLLLGSKLQLPKAQATGTPWSSLLGKPFVTVSLDGNGDYGPSTPGTKTQGLKEARLSGRRVYINSGAYSIDETIALDGNVAYEGEEHWDGDVRISPSGDFPVFSIGQTNKVRLRNFLIYQRSGGLQPSIKFTSTSTIQEFELEKLTFNGVGGSTGYAIDSNIYSGTQGKALRTEINQCKFLNCNGIEGDGLEGLWINKSHFANAPSYSIYAQTGLNYAKISENLFESSTSASTVFLYIINSGWVKILNNDMTLTGQTMSFVGNNRTTSYIGNHHEQASASLNNGYPAVIICSQSLPFIGIGNSFASNLDNTKKPKYLFQIGNNSTIASSRVALHSNAFTDAATANVGYVGTSFSDISIENNI